MPGPKYTWETVKNDPAKRDELFRIVEALQKRLKLTTDEAGTLDQLMDLSLQNKVPLSPEVAVSLQKAVPLSAERVAKTLETMRELVEQGDERQSDFEDCMANLSSTLSKVKQALPDKYRSLGDIEGFGDLSASADALLPEPGTAGQYALTLQDGIWGQGEIPSEMLGGPKLNLYFEYMALEETTRGAKDWRKVLAVPKEHIDRSTKLLQVFVDGLDAEIDNFDKEMEPDRADPMLLSFPGRHKTDRFVTEHLGLVDMQTYREEYVSRLNGNIKSLETQNEEAVKNGRAGDVKDLRTAFRSNFNVMMLQSMTAARLKEGVSSFMDFANSYLDSEKLLDAEMDRFLEKHSQKEVKRLLAADDSGEAFTKAFKQHIVELDKLPETGDSYFFPTAKERIEFLQAQMRQKGANKLHCAAGILAAREAVDAARGSAGKMDPRLNEHIGPGMAERVQMWEKRLGQLTPEQQEKLCALAVKGHGGAMKEQIHDLLKDRPEMQDVPRSADKWIEMFQKDPALGKDDGTDVLVNIMAARMLANSVRGSKKSLTDKMLTAEAIAQKAEELKDNEIFQNFLYTLDDDPKAMRKAVSAAKSGHGGALDDMFKKHLKELSAGALVNDPLLARYMPTVKERIESLQAQAPRHTGALENTVAEIVVLRNLAHAERGKAEAASLDKPIPTDKRGSLQADTLDLLRYTGFDTVINYEVGTAETLAMIAKEHGGEMAEFFRREANAPTNLAPPPPESKAIFNANTISARLSQLQSSARSLQNRTEQNGVAPEAKREAAGLLGEYILLDKLTRDPRTGQIDESKLLADVPWSKVEKSSSMGFEKSELFKSLTESMGDDLAQGVMKDMATMKQADFFESLARKMSAAAQKNQEKVPPREVKQPRVEKELSKAAVPGQG